MAKKDTPKTGPDKSVLLVVKGVGVHKQDDTLNAFLKGFLVAISSYAKINRIFESPDIYTPDNVSEHEADIHKHVTEVQIEKTDKRKHTTFKGTLWIKEVYWEGALRTPSSLSTLLGLWQMLTYSWGRVIYDWIVGHLKRDRRAKMHNFWLAMFIKYLSVLLFPAYVFLSTKGMEIPLETTIIIAAVASLVIAWPPAFYASAWHKLEPMSLRPKLLGMANWVLPLEVISIFYLF